MAKYEIRKDGGKFIVVQKQNLGETLIPLISSFSYKDCIKYIIEANEN